MRQALVSRWSLDYRVMAIASLPTLLILPLIEGDGTLETIWLLFLCNLLSLGLAIATMAIAKELTWVKSHWSVVLFVASAIGALRGATLWSLIELSQISQPALLSRIFFSSFSWMVSVMVLAHIQAALGTSISRQREVRALLLKARQQFETLEDQRDWLTKTKVSGLDRELAKEFVSLLDSLNKKGQGPGAFRAIANQLRQAARGEIRERSKSVWEASGLKVTRLFPKAFFTKPNPALVVAVFTGTSLINGLRLGGLSVGLLAPALSGVILWFGLRFVSKTKLHLLAAIPAGIATSVGLGVTQQSIFIGAGVASTLWAMSTIFIGSLVEISRLRIEEQREQDLAQLENTEAEIEWLTLQMETTNLEIAKYLHSILQTRLMSHALLIERGSGQDIESMQQLTELLTNPMADFGLEVASLDVELEHFAEQWRPILDIKIDSTTCRLDLAAGSTLLVIREAVSNSSNHGHATEVEIVISDVGAERTITVSDNGVGPTKNPTGMGTQTFDSLGTSWSLSASKSGGAVLKLVLPLGVNND